MILKTWSGSRVECGGRYHLWLMGWIRHCFSNLRRGWQALTPTGKIICILLPPVFVIAYLFVLRHEVQWRRKLDYVLDRESNGERTVKVSCSWCNGSGMDNGDECEKCEGIGEVLSIRRV